MKRHDDKGRELRKGEYQNKGKYEYHYIDKYGKARCLYSWRLEKNDKIPPNARGINQPLRDMERDLEELRDREIDYYEKETLTLNQCYETQLMTGWGSDAISDDSRMQYIRYYKSHIEPVFGNMAVSKIKKSDVEMFFADLRKKGYKAGTVRNIRSALATLLDIAVGDGLISSNPARLAKVKVGKNEVIESKLKRKALDDDELRLFERLCREADTAYTRVMLILTHTGARVGEITALQWKDIDLQKDTISISKTQHYKRRKPEDEHMSHYVTSPKSENSVRVVEIDPRLKPLLQKMYDEHYKPDKILKSRKSLDEEYVFTKDGELLTDNAVWYQTNKLVEKYNETAPEDEKLRHITPHMLRHTFITTAAEAGVNVNLVSAIVGHSDVTTTMRTYTHAQQSAVKEAQARIGEAIADKLIG